MSAEPATRNGDFLHGPARVVSVNVGMPRTLETKTRLVTTAIWKSPVTGRVRTRGVNLEGDGQADRRNHGGPHKAIYA
jgi:MOSC domain-containing protein YiiM